jgi:hypothetical protein
LSRECCWLDCISLISFPCADSTSPIFFTRLISPTLLAPMTQILASPPW